MSISNLLFIQLAIVLGLCASFGFLFRYLKLPLVVGFLLAGVVISFFRFFDASSSAALTAFPNIGIAFALFFIGMELDLKEIKQLGKPIFFAGLGQIIFANLFGFTIASFFGFPKNEALFLGIGLSFSSTIVVVKMLLERKDLNSLYGKLSVGILLLEDLVAIIVLMGMTVGSSVFNLGSQNSLPIITFLIKGALLFLISFGISRFLLKNLFKAAAFSSELLFLTAIAWCFSFVAFSIALGFSVVIGAFLAGVGLASSPFHYEIQGKVKPLRDFFVTLFFVYLGSQVIFENISTALPVIVVFILYALVLKPIILLLILGVFGLRRHTMFQVAINLSQISEFSLIIMLVGVNLGIVSHAALTVMTLTGVVSITGSSLMISFSRQIYKKIGFLVGFFERTNYIHKVEEKRKREALKDHVIVVGGHRMGGEVIKYLKRQKIPFLVLDFNPKIVQILAEGGVDVLYGDIGDPEILDFLNLAESRLIVSTARDIDDNLTLLSEVKRRKSSTIVITRAETLQDAQTLYRAGAEYVILPEVVSGVFISESLESHWSSLDYFKSRAEIELNKLTKALELEL